MEDLAASVLQKLSSQLSLDPNQKKKMSEIDRKWRFAVVGKTIFPTGRDRAGLMLAIKDCWKKLHPKPEISPVTDEIYIIRFFKPEHLQLAIEKGPWRIYGQVFLMKKHSWEIAPENFLFEDFKIWFYFDELPHRYIGENEINDLLREKFSGIIGDKFTVSGIYPEHSFPSDCRGFKVQLTVKCEAALPLGIEAEDGYGGKKFIFFNYQNLPSFFCTRCRVIGHKSFMCSVKDDDLQGIRQMDWQRDQIHQTRDLLEDTTGNIENGKNKEASTANPEVFSETAIARVSTVELQNPNTQALGPSSSHGPLSVLDPVLHAVVTPEEHCYGAPATEVTGQVSTQSPNQLGCIARPSRLGPTVVTNTNQLLYTQTHISSSQPDTVVLNEEAMDRIRDFLPTPMEQEKQKGKRSSVEATERSRSGSGKKIRLESVMEENDEEFNQQTEIQNPDLNGDQSSLQNILNPPDFLGIDFGNLPAVVEGIQRNNQLMSSTFSAINPLNQNNPHTVNIMRIGELLPTGGTGRSGTAITRFHPYPHLYAPVNSGNRQGARLRSRMFREDRQSTDLDFLSLDIHSGAREEPQQSEPSTQSVESVGESSTSPSGRIT